MDDIGAEFHKLLVARASLRVMVCEEWWQPGEDDSKGGVTAKRLCQHVRGFQGARIDDTCLLVVYEWHEHRWHSWRYRMRVNIRGKLPTLDSLRFDIGRAATNETEGTA